MLATVYGKKVLIVDMDPQHNTSARFSSHEWANIVLSIYNGEDLDEGEKSVEDLLLDRNLDPHVAIKKTDYENMDIIPAYLTLSFCEDLMKADVKSPQQFQLKNQLKKLDEEYDYCLIDCSPSINILNVNALVASDEVYLPVRTDGDSVIGMSISLNLVKQVQEYNSDLKIGGVFLTQCIWQEGVAKATYEFLKQLLPSDMLIPIQIGNSKFLKENSFMQIPLLIADNGKRKSMATQAYLLLTEYIMAPNKKEFVQKNEERLNKLKHLEIKGEE
jgi:chromosome partitioning protein